MEEVVLNVTDLAKYLYCPRQFYLEKIKGIKKPINKEMMEGRIRHEAFELFSKHEKDIIEGIETKEEIKRKYEEFLEKLILNVLKENCGAINAFNINKNIMKEKIENQIRREIVLRIRAIEETIRKGFIKKDIWTNLEPKYYSEFSVFSEELGLKGRVDRVVIDKNEIIPFELKTREIEKVYESDEIQITAYIMLLEKHFNKKITYGIVEAGNEKFQIEINEKNRNKVLELINEIRTCVSKRFPSNFSKCEKCGYKNECDELL